MPSFEVKAFRSRRQPVIVAFPNRRKAKRRSETRAEPLLSPEAAAGVTDVSGALGGIPLQRMDEPAAVAVVIDLVTGATISGASSGQDMAASEIGEPRSVSGGALLAGPAQAEGPSNVITMLDDAAGHGLILPRPAPPEASHPQPTGLACVPVADATAVLTGHVMLADGVVVAFGSALPSGDVCSDRRLE